MKFISPILTGWSFCMTLVVLSACADDKSTNIVNVSDIEVAFELKRFDRDLFRADTVQWDSSWVELKEQYPVFTELYTRDVLRLGGRKAGDSLLSQELRSFITAPSVRGLFDTVQRVYPDLSETEEAFRQAFRYYRYYFPNRDVPDVYTFVSEFTLATFIFQDAEERDALALGLDFFLGDAFPYDRVSIPGGSFSGYLSRTFNRDHMVKKTLDALISDLVGPVPRSDLLNQMIHYGKIVYLSDYLLPRVPDTVIMEYKPEQLEWCRENEQNVWSYFLSKDLLYSEDWSKTRAYLQPAPHSRGMPPEAPGRTAVWLGWQIVREFMQRHPDVSLEELIDLKDAQYILDASKYKPRR